MSRLGKTAAMEAPRRDALRVLAMGAVWLPLSFPAYLLLNSSRSLWRTQILSGPGTAMILSGAIFLAARGLPWSFLRRMATLACLAVVTYTGARAAIDRGGVHRAIWEKHRRVVAAVVRTVPQVSAGTIMVLTNVPKADGPFGDGMWFDLALRLAYPCTRVAGVFWQDDGQPGPGNLLQLTAGGWQWDTRTMQPMVTQAPMAQTLALRYQAGEDRVRVLEAMPEAVCPAAGCPSGYAPLSRIVNAAPSPRAVRRYLVP